jgi:hypothetical protein
MWKGYFALYVACPRKIIITKREGSFDGQLYPKHFPRCYNIVRSTPFTHWFENINGNDTIIFGHIVKNWTMRGKNKYP